MDFLHHQFQAGPEDVIEVTLDHPANVQLLDATNYDHYRHGRTFRYYGGYATESPVRLTPPRRGEWHLVIDLGGGVGSVEATAKFVPGALERSAS